MARLNETLVAAREQFVKDFFKAQPMQGVREANDALTLAHPGGKMGLRRAYELEGEVKGVNGEKVQALMVALATGQPVVLAPEDVVKGLTDARLAAEQALAEANAKVTALEAQVLALTPAPKAQKGPTLKERILGLIGTGTTLQGLAAALNDAKPAALRSRLSEMVKDGTLTKAENGTLTLTATPVEAVTAAVVEVAATHAIEAPAPTVEPTPAPVETAPVPADAAVVNGAPTA